MDMQPILSSTIHSAGYDPDSKKLHVAFHSGQTYEYSDVPQDAFDSLMSASSIGSHFHRHIRNEYDNKKL